MTAPSRRRIARAALAAALAAACAGPGFEPQELPEAPIAVVHRTREESERVADLLESARKQSRRRPDDAPIRLEEVSDYLGLGPTPEQRRAALQGRLALVEPRSGEVTRLDFAPPRARPLDWSPERRRLLLMGHRGGTPQLFEYRFDRREHRPVTYGPAAHVSGCYGPDRRYFVARAAALEGGESGIRIFLTEPGGGSPRPVTPGPRDVAPDWSEEAGVLVYQTRDEAGRDAIAAVAREEGGFGEARLLARGREPEVSPDGRWVVYSTETRRGERLWRMRPDGSARRAVAETGQEQRFPAVSPDGRFVAYTVPDEHRRTLWVRRLDGVGGARPLVTAGDALRPQW